VGEISGLAISGLRKKLADSSSANPLILDSIFTNLHLKYSNSDILVYCSGPWKLDSQCRLSKAHVQLRKTPGGRDLGMGREWGGWKWGDQFTSNLGPRWTGSYHVKEGFQVSKGKWKGSKGESERGSKE
jgi:hypothetical protein